VFIGGIGALLAAAFGVIAARRSEARERTRQLLEEN
jgi:predicted outer membrane lipoprotein